MSRYMFSLAINQEHADRNTKIISLVKDEGFSHSAVARLYGLTQPTVSSVIRRGSFATTVI